ncbi:ATP synthase subunit g, mitochondrial-like [Phyllostomus hastatus]|uniref:ATP synthase subunit g, mitochondrial-like n=1 Tax=Phyllostomus hastatus TaxID=9423 RepID=UPI001E67F6B4|nr:ATP synthase subunit g, mitochondrial-like [Phyllostomus hastatus]
MAQFAHRLAEKAPVLVNVVVTPLKPRVATFWPYAKVELTPPTPAEILQLLRACEKRAHSALTGGFKQLTLEEALPNGLVATEVQMRFYVGEITGKRGIVGCNV